MIGLDANIFLQQRHSRIHWFCIIDGQIYKVYTQYLRNSLLWKVGPLHFTVELTWKFHIVLSSHYFHTKQSWSTRLFSVFQPVWPTPYVSNLSKDIQSVQWIHLVRKKITPWKPSCSKLWISPTMQGKGGKVTVVSFIEVGVPETQILGGGERCRGKKILLFSTISCQYSKAHALMDERQPLTARVCPKFTSLHRKAIRTGRCLHHWDKSLAPLL